jgi:hypothetical protein
MTSEDSAKGAHFRANLANKLADSFNIDHLSSEIIKETDLRIDLENLAKVCYANKQINSLLCASEGYWQDFGNPTVKLERSIQDFTTAFPEKPTKSEGLRDCQVPYVVIYLPLSWT